MGPDKLELEYGVLPPWAEALRAAAPAFYEGYLALRAETLRDGALTRKEKDLLLVGVNAARRYRPSMLGHARLAVKWGATPDEVLETVQLAILSRGIPSWMEGLEAVRLAEEAVGKVARSAAPRADAAAAEPTPSWLAAFEERSPAAAAAYGSLRGELLVNGRLPRQFRELVLVAINLGEGYEPGIRLHTENARRFGATDEHLVEVALTTVLTAGIPAWFNIVPHLRRPSASATG
jgi:AhpD family alkylhydroperoxidase